MSCDPVKVAESLKRVRKIEEWLREKFIGEQFKDVIRCVLLCALADVPILLVGPPGGAKTRLVTKLYELLLRLPDGARTEGKHDTYFQYLVHPFTQPEELLGAMDIKQFLDNRLFERNKAGSMMDSSVRAIFLDEVFNANSAILNALLSLMNERVIYEHGTAKKSNAVLIAGATNQVPQDHELQAFYDRFPVRFYVDATVTAENSYEIVKQSCADLREKKGIDAPGGQTQRIIDAELARIDDIVLLQGALLEKYTSFEMVDETAKDAWHRLIRDLNQQDGIRLNGRTLGHLFRLSAAHAMLNDKNNIGRPGIQAIDFKLPFQSIWHRSDDRRSLSGSVERILDLK